MSYILLIFYLLLCSWLLCKIKFTANAGLSKKIIVILFITKVFAGMFYGWLHHKYTNADTWQYHSLALREYYLLFGDPKEYFTNLFVSNYGDKYSGLFGSLNSFWNDLKTNLIVKFLSVLNIFSLGNYYINVVIYNFLTFFGLVALFKTFDKIYKNQRSILVFTCFLLPSFLFYSSGVHKEGLIIAALGVVVYNIYQSLHFEGLTFKRIILILLPLCFIFLLRNFIFIAFMPAAIVWIISDRKKYKPLITFSIVYVIGGILFFTLNKFIPSINLPAAILEKQQAFNLMEANTAVQLDQLHPTFISFVTNAPQAFMNSTLRPFVTDGKMLVFLYPLSVEIIFYELVFLGFIFFRKRDSVFFSNPFVVFGLVFSFSLLLIIGYITPALGAIVRYRSLYLPFIITPLLCNIDYKKIASIVPIKK